MSLFTHLDLGIGVEYPEGGIFRFITALESLCNEYKVQILTGEAVSRISVHNRRATSVTTNKGKYEADLVISNADYPFTETQLLEKQWQSYPESYWSKKTIAPSAFILFLGIKGKLPQLLHHNYYFPLDWNAHFETIAKKSGLPYDPLIYFSCTSKSDPTVAPKNHENLFVTAAIPPDIHISQEEKSRYAQHLIQKLERVTGEEIIDNIVLQKIFTVDDFIETFNAYKGTSIGLSQTVSQSMMLRPKQQSSKVQNLYYVGQYTNPGIGMPMCLISAQLVVKKISDE